MGLPDFQDVVPYDVSRETYARLVRYYELLLKWQRRINLISPSTVPHAWGRHFLDSLQLLRYVPCGAKVLVDLGSGGGFAGLVLGICRPELRVHLIDSDLRKTQFLTHVSRETSADGVRVQCGRVEAVLPDLDPDVITARGFAALPVILDMSVLAYGVDVPELLLLKGARYQQELDAAAGGFEFSCEAFVSETDETARILRLFDVSKL